MAKYVARRHSECWYRASFQTFSRDCSKGFGRRVGKSSSELPLGFVRILTATVVSFHFAKYTFPKDPSPICFCICICSKLTCTWHPCQSAVCSCSCTGSLQSLWVSVTVYMLSNNLSDLLCGLEEALRAKDLRIEHQ